MRGAKDDVVVIHIQKCVRETDTYAQDVWLPNGILLLSEMADSGITTNQGLYLAKAEKKIVCLTALSSLEDQIFAVSK
eukprot:g5534.t1